MQKDFPAQVRAYMEQFQMVSPGDHIVAGVSGGADSTALLLLLDQLRTAMGFSLSAVHIDHMIRGQAAKRDAAFVKDLCAQRGIPCRLYEKNVPAMAAARSLTEEEAGREARREACAEEIRRIREASPAGLPETGKSGGEVRLALAHTMDDQAETVLLFLARGTGLAGLGGIRPSSDHTFFREDGSCEKVTVIRPLLFAERRGIEAYLKACGIPFAEDATNREDTYARNRIRHHVLPYLTEEINRKAVRHIAEAAQRAREAEEVLTSVIEEKRHRYLTVSSGGEGLFIRNEAFSGEPAPMTGYLLREALESYAGRKKDLGAVHVEALRDLYRLPAGSRRDLPYGMTACREYDGILLIKKKPGPEQGAGEDPEIPLVPGKEIIFRGWRIRAEYTREIPRPVQEKSYTKWIDFAIIGEKLCVRSRRPGDFLTADAAGSRKSLSDYLINEKVPRRERDRIPVIACGDHVLWAVGHRISYAARITDQTETAVRITACPPEKPEDGTGNDVRENGQTIRNT